VVFVTRLEEKGDNCFKFSDDDEQKVRKFIETGGTVETGETVETVERPTVATLSGSTPDVSEEDVTGSAAASAAAAASQPTAASAAATVPPPAATPVGEDVARPLGGKLGKPYGELEPEKPRQDELLRGLETLDRTFKKPTTKTEQFIDFLTGKPKEGEKLKHELDELKRGLDEHTKTEYLRRKGMIAGGKKTKKKPRRKTQLKSRKYNHKTLKRKSKTYRRRRNR